MELLKTLPLLYYLLQYVWESLCYKLWGAGDSEEEDAKGKVAVITDGSAGIGKSLAIKLATRGATVVLGCRNEREGKTAQEDVMYEARSKKVHLYKLDLEDFESVQEFAKNVSQSFPEIHLLINNAGVCFDSPKLQKSPNGYERHMCINHLGHFLLTNLLLPNIKAGAPSRIIMVSSTCMMFSELDVHDLFLQDISHPTKTNVIPAASLPYSNSQLAICLFAKELGQRLMGSGVTTYSVCPGLTNAVVNLSNCSKVGMVVAKICLALIGISKDKAADSVLYCALSQNCDSETGKFYRFGKVCVSGNRKLKKEVAKRLWDVSDRLVARYYRE